MPDQDRARRRRLGGEALQPRCSARSGGGEPADLPPDVRRRGCNGVVVVRLEPHDARGLRGAKPTGKTVPSVIGTSPKTSPGMRSPTTRSTRR